MKHAAQFFSTKFNTDECLTGRAGVQTEESMLSAWTEMVHEITPTAEVARRPLKADPHVVLEQIVDFYFSQMDLIGKSSHLVRTCLPLLLLTSHSRPHPVRSEGRIRWTAHRAVFQRRFYNLINYY
jgi:hypothetical protein